MKNNLKPGTRLIFFASRKWPHLAGRRATVTKRGTWQENWTDWHGRHRTQVEVKIHGEKLPQIWWLGFWRRL